MRAFEERQKNSTALPNLAHAKFILLRMNPVAGLGNRMVALVSGFLLSLITEVMPCQRITTSRCRLLAAVCCHLPTALQRALLVEWEAYDAARTHRSGEVVLQHTAQSPMRLPYKLPFLGPIHHHHRTRAGRFIDSQRRCPPCRRCGSSSPHPSPATRPTFSALHRYRPQLRGPSRGSSRWQRRCSHRANVPCACDRARVRPPIWRVRRAGGRRGPASRGTRGPGGGRGLTRMRASWPPCATPTSPPPCAPTASWSLAARPPPPPPPPPTHNHTCTRTQIHTPVIVSECVCLNISAYNIFTCDCCCCCCCCCSSTAPSSPSQRPVG